VLPYLSALENAWYLKALYKYPAFYCMALEHWSQPKFTAWYKERNNETFAEGATYIQQGGHHVGQWPAFKLQHVFGIYVFNDE